MKKWGKAVENEGVLTAFSLKITKKHKKSYKKWWSWGV